MARSDGQWESRIVAARRRGRFDAEDLEDVSGWDMSTSPVAEQTMRVGQTIRCWSQAQDYFEGRLVALRDDMRRAVKGQDFDEAEVVLAQMGHVARVLTRRKEKADGAE